MSADVPAGNAVSGITPSRMTGGSVDAATTCTFAGRIRARRMGRYSVGSGNRIAIRIDFGMSHRRRQPIDLLRTETMFLPLRFDVHAIERHAELLGEIDLPQPVRAHDVERQALAFGGQPQVRAVTVNE